MTLEHTSYSQHNTYSAHCPRAWWLGKVAKAEEAQTWYLPIGSAVHEMIEAHLLIKEAGAGQAEPNAEQYFYPLVAKQMQVEPDLSKWLSGGKKGEEVTEDRALQKVKDCFEKALEFLDDLDVWEVECDASGALPGLSVPIKAYVDIIGEHKDHGPVILDWKTGRTKPKNNMQLFTYSALLTVQNQGARAYDKGIWAMLDPNASQARPVDLSAVDPREIGEKYQRVVDLINAQKFESLVEREKDKPGKPFGCRMCFQAPNCMDYSGLTERTMYYGVPQDTPPY